MTDPEFPEGIPNRLYGRRRGHKLRPRQELLLSEALPRMRYESLDFAKGAARTWLEVGFGGGEHTLALMAANPDTAIIASEVYEHGLCSLLTQIIPDGQEATCDVPARLRLWPEDARALLLSLPEASLDRMFLMFPDPWPKARHSKRRFVHPEILPIVARALKPGAIWRIASDDPTYQAWVEEVLRASPLFEAAEPAKERPEGWPPTRYEAKAIEAGRHPMYWEWVRK
ncbi:tRNA (guanosine(46)-N7)-methyltransferase TrmB [Rhodovarius crocodyli]|uniref:tRNA (guanine-N(7)-)-methyltransferase n=1 Tax=Rhodovarius crocodyli TaxID=1979269 RepID=A0A437MNI0_9PROT|nr:tRNA (guanine(46)-N(7))-methyltransferase TrmB [Rhodovarius crocodyli]RVT99203.1 tRNA (guanosine(46)-N7)-methyltransferase TrmB [Rhodovarius crocodyli]